MQEKNGISSSKVVKSEFTITKSFLFDFLSRKSRSVVFKGISNFSFPPDDDDNIWIWHDNDENGWFIAPLFSECKQMIFPLKWRSQIIASGFYNSYLYCSVSTWLHIMYRRGGRASMRLRLGQVWFIVQKFDWKTISSQILASIYLKGERIRKLADLGQYSMLSSWAPPDNWLVKMIQAAL